MKGTINKAIIIGLMVCIGAGCLAGCGDTSEKNEGLKENNKTEHESAVKTEAPVVTEKKIEPKIAYMGDRSVDYQSQTKQHRVFFSFLDENETRVNGAGMIVSIKIVSDKDETIFEKEYTTASSDYTEWSNKFTDESKYLGCIYVNDNELQEGSSETGKLIISAHDKDGLISFQEDEQYISNLPLKSLQINMPTVPVEIKNYNWDNSLQRKINVQDISFESSNTNSIKVNIVASMTYNQRGNSYSDYSMVGYKIKDSAGVIVSSGTFFLSQSKVGEVIQDGTYVYGLDLSETYTLELEDVQ